MTESFKPKDIIAILILVSAVFLIFNGFESQLNEIIALVVGYYFGHRTTGVDSGD